MPQQSPGRAESRCQLAEITGRIQSCGSINSKKTRKEHCGHYKESTERTDSTEGLGLAGLPPAATACEPTLQYSYASLASQNVL